MFFRFEAVRTSLPPLVVWVCYSGGCSANPPVRVFVHCEAGEDSVSLDILEGKFVFVTCYAFAERFTTSGFVELFVAEIDGDEDQGGRGFWAPESMSE